MNTLVEQPTRNKRLQLRHLGVIFGLACGLLVVSTVALANEWRPISSERLVKLPAPVMAKALEQDFRSSGLAESIKDSSETLADIKGSLEQLTADLSDVEGEVEISTKHELLKQKSAYLDEMEQYQEFMRKAATTKTKTYEQLLKELQKNRSLANDPVSREVRAAQLAARTRMQAHRQSVDNNLFPMIASEGSKYTREYEGNLAKIEQLQVAIRNHDANRSATLDGEKVSREAFIHHLLVEAEADVALLDQEDEMLGLMARLVALDAQTLQMEVAYGPEFEELAKLDERKPRNMIDFFTN